MVAMDGTVRRVNTILFKFNNTVKPKKKIIIIIIGTSIVQIFQLFRLASLVPVFHEY